MKKFLTFKELDGMSVNELLDYKKEIQEYVINLLEHAKEVRTINKMLDTRIRDVLDYMQKQIEAEESKRLERVTVKDWAQSWIH